MPSHFLTLGQGLLLSHWTHPFLVGLHHLLSPTQDHLQAKTPAPGITPDELPNDQDCGYKHVSAEGYGFTQELNYSSEVEEGRGATQALRGHIGSYPLLCSLEGICRVWSGLRSTGKQVWSSQAHRNTQLMELILFTSMNSWPCYATPACVQTREAQKRLRCQVILTLGAQTGLLTRDPISFCKK